MAVAMAGSPQGGNPTTLINASRGRLSRHFGLPSLTPPLLASASLSLSLSLNRKLMQLRIRCQAGSENCLCPSARRSRSRRRPAPLACHARLSSVAERQKCDCAKRRRGAHFSRTAIPFPPFRVIIE